MSARGYLVVAIVAALAAAWLALKIVGVLIQLLFIAAAAGLAAWAYAAWRAERG